MIESQSFFSLEAVVGILSVFIFLYRAVVLMFPMMNEAIRKKDTHKFMNSLTLLV